jgi:hypothetical protein
LTSILKTKVASSSHSVASARNDKATVDRKGKSLLKLPSADEGYSSVASGDVAGRNVQDSESQSVFGNFQATDPTQDWRTYF